MEIHGECPKKVFCGCNQCPLVRVFEIVSRAHREHLLIQVFRYVRLGGVIHDHAIWQWCPASMSQFACQSASHSVVVFVCLNTQQPLYSLNLAVPAKILHAMAPKWFLIFEHEFAADPENVSTFSSETVFFVADLFVLALYPLVFVVLHVIGAWSDVESPAHA